VYRGVNLEHAAASLPNILQTMVLIALISLVMLGVTGPDFTVFAIHPVSPLLLITYLYGLYLARTTHQAPMWKPKRTRETRTDVPDEHAKREPLLRLWGIFLVLATVVAITGFVVAHAGLSLMKETQLSGTIVGGLMTSIVTSLPELVTVIAAVRAGALTLAVGDIIGGNTFDVLFVAAADGMFRSGSVYHAIGDATQFILTLTMLLTSILAAGMIFRGKRGIGFEGLAILLIYIGGFSIVFFL
jgi:cation:H+ antiporter